MAKIKTVYYVWFRKKNERRPVTLASEEYQDLYTAVNFASKQLKTEYKGCAAHADIQELKAEFDSKGMIVREIKSEVVFVISQFQ